MSWFLPDLRHHNSADPRRRRRRVRASATGCSAAEWVHAVFDLPFVGDAAILRPLGTSSGFVEGRYRFHPRWQVSARVEHLGFSEIRGTLNGGLPTSWEAPVRPGRGRARLPGAPQYRGARRLSVELARRRPRAASAATPPCSRPYGSDARPAAPARRRDVRPRAGRAPVAAGAGRARFAVAFRSRACRAPAGVQLSPISPRLPWIRSIAGAASRTWSRRRARPSTQLRTGRVRMDQRNEQFVPHLLAITVGTIVDFPNSDTTFHNVFSLARGNAFDLGRYPPGHTGGPEIRHAGHRARLRATSTRT